MSPRITPLDARLLAALERAFREHAGASARIDVPHLQKALGLRSEYLARRVLQAFDRDHDGSIDRDEFLEGVRQLVLGTDREKLAFAFRVHDHDGDGFLDRQEMLRMIAISLAESNVARDRQPPEQLTSVLFGLADRDRDGRISFDELDAVVKMRPELLAHMTASEAMWILPNEDLVARLDAGERVVARRGSVDRGWLPAAFLTVWALAHAGIFVFAMQSARGGPAPNLWMQIGRALGACIDFDGALILVPMMRSLLTRVRRTWLGRVIPVDDAIDRKSVV